MAGKQEVRKIKLKIEEEKLAVLELIHYFEQEFDEEIGNLQGIMLLEFFLEKIGPAIYNQAVTDAQQYMNEKVEDLYGIMYNNNFSV